MKDALSVRWAALVIFVRWYVVDAAYCAPMLLFDPDTFVREKGLMARFYMAMLRRRKP